MEESNTAFTQLLKLNLHVAATSHWLFPELFATLTQNHRDPLLHNKVTVQ